MGGEGHEIWARLGGGAADFECVDIMPRGALGIAYEDLTITTVLSGLELSSLRRAVWLRPAVGRLRASGERGHRWYVQLPSGRPVVPDLHYVQSRLQARRRLQVDNP